MYNNIDKTSRIALWKASDLKIRKDDNHLIPIDLNNDKNEFIIRIYHSHICHHWFIIITNLGNIILFNPNTKTFDYTSKHDKNRNNDNSKLINVKLHDSISSSGYHKKLTHISFIYSDNKVKIIPISFNAKSNTLSVHDPMLISTPKNVSFYQYEDTKNENDDDEDQDIDIKERTDTSKSREVIIFDYDWCLDTNQLLLLTNKGSIMCLEDRYKDKDKDKDNNNTNTSWKGYKIKYTIDITQQLDISVMNDESKLLLTQLNSDNHLFSKSNTCLLSFIRIKFIETSQFVVVGPSRNDYNTLKLWTFQAKHGILRDGITLLAQNVNSDLLMLAPLICSIRHKDHQQQTHSQHLGSSLIDCYVITSKQVISARLPSLGKSLLDLVEISIENERKQKMEIDDNDNDENVIIFSLSNKQRIERFVSKSDWNDAQNLLNEMTEIKSTKIDQSLFNLMLDTLIENEKWDLIKGYFVLISDHNETDLLYLLSLMISHLNYFIENELFISCLNKILSAKINDIFMKRCIQILPQSQVEIFVKYLCYSLNTNNDKNGLKIEIIITWLNIILDSHLGTLAFADNDNNDKEKNGNLREYVMKIRTFLRNYDQRINGMMDIQANIHSILNGMKVEYEKNKNETNLKNRNTSKSMSGIGGGLFGSNKFENNDNDPNLYKDYVIEYIKL